VEQQATVGGPDARWRRSKWLLPEDYHGSPFQYTVTACFSLPAFVGEREMKTRTKAGFTLIELLVVIGIIAILAAILFPVFARVKENAKTSVCAQQMRQVGMSIAMYTSDNNDGLPVTWVWNSPPNWCDDYATWKQATKPYQKADNLYVCPSFTQPGFDCKQFIANPQVRYLGQFGVNNWAYVDHFTNVNPSVTDYKMHEFAKLSGIDLPADTLMISENGDGDWIVEPEPYKCTDPVLGQAVFTNEPGIIKFRHNGQSAATAAFLDGHMKVLSREQFHANNCYIWWKHKPSQ
jgi:prepilin-type N-terminal cleavage/methylation domain-containing protein/prepilin-type processing-associated H-X9-DG protein